MPTLTVELPARQASPARWAAVAFVASYSSPGTRQAYGTQLRLWFDWCAEHQLDPLADVRRPHVELYARDLETRELAPATVALKLVVITGSTATASRNDSSSIPRRCMCADRRSPRSPLGSASTEPNSERSSSKPACPAAMTTSWLACLPSTPSA